MSAEDKKKDGGGWTKIPVKVRPPVVNENHPVVKKILEYIEKEIEPIEDEMERHLKYNSYIGYLSMDELVIFGIYHRIRRVPAIYKYYKTQNLSENDFSELVNILVCFY
jgi:hypothetical protein